MIKSGVTRPTSFARASRLKPGRTPKLPITLATQLPAT